MCLRHDRLLLLHHRCCLHCGLLYHRSRVHFGLGHHRSWRLHNRLHLLCGRMDVLLWHCSHRLLRNMGRHNGLSDRRGCLRNGLHRLPLNGG